MRKYIDLVLSFILGYFVAFGGFPAIIVMILFLEFTYWFFVALAEMQYKRRFHATERRDLAKKYGVKKFYVTKEKVVHGYADMVLVPKDFDEKIVKMATEMARKQPGMPLKQRLLSYIVLFLGALMHAFIFIR